MADRFLSHLAVFVIVRNRDGDILLQQRQNTGFLDGYWDFPSGHIENGESVQSAARRELKEEVGLQVAENDLKLRHINQNFLDVPYLGFTFEATTWTGQPTIGEPEKVASIDFYSTDKLPELCSLNVHVQQQAKFSPDLTYSIIDPANFESVMGEPFNPETWGKK